jgi:hypothetical protein
MEIQIMYLWWRSHLGNRSGGAQELKQRRGCSDKSSHKQRKTSHFVSVVSRAGSVQQYADRFTQEYHSGLMSEG